MNRRQFISTSSAAAAVTALSAVALEGCTRKAPEAAEEAALGEIPTDQMTLRYGKHGEGVSILGYGCMRWPQLPDGQVQTSGPAKGSDIDQEAVNRLVDYAIEHGVNYFDASPMYCKGLCEQATGIALARHPRSSYFIATKLSNFDPYYWPREKSIEMYEASFRNLQTDVIDFYLLHSVGGSGFDNFSKRYVDNGMIEFLMEERKKGKIRNLGFSFHGDIKVWDWCMEQHERIQWDFVQIQHNYVDWTAARRTDSRHINSQALYNDLAERDIPVVVMEPLLGGRLSKLNRHATAELKALAPQRSIASWAFRFAATQPRILTVLSGMTYLEHLQDNLRSYAPFQPLTDAEIALLERIGHEFASFPTVPCTNCQYCMPCPYGIDIPGVFRHFNTCLNEGLMQDDPAASDFKKLRRQYLKTYLEAVQRERQADHCIGCNQCVSRCPQNIKIPEQMQRIDQYEQMLRESL